jgi:hypothetical protein
LILWTARAIGIAMCQNAVEVAERLESAYGYKQTSSRPKLRSALPPIADMLRGSADIPGPQPSSPTQWKTLSVKGLKFSARIWKNISGIL